MMHETTPMITHSHITVPSFLCSIKSYNISYPNIRNNNSESDHEGTRRPPL